MNADWQSVLGVSVLVLMLTALVAPTWVALRRARGPEGLRIDHVVLFSFGFVFYGILPIALGVSRIGSGNFGLNVWFAYFDANVGLSQIAIYLASMLLFYGAFVGGSRLGARRKSHLSLLALDMDVNALNLFWPAIVGFGAAYVWAVRGSLFKGYTAYAEFYSAGGTLSAVALILLSFVLLRASFSEGVRPSAGSRGVMRLYIAVYCCFAVVLLSLGGRLYVVTSIMMVLTYVSMYRRRLPYKAVASLFAAGAAGVGAIGVIRLGAGGLSPIALMENIFGEPLFTSFSLLNFLGQNRFELVNVPRFLAGDLLNLIPSFIFPSKTLFLPDPSRFGYVIYAPLGALHMFFSFVINFGIIGSALVLLGLGAWLSWIGGQNSPLARVIYSMVSGSLAFTLFRDPFSVSLVKNMFEFSVLVPALLTVGAHAVSLVSARTPSDISTRSAATSP